MRVCLIEDAPVICDRLIELIRTVEGAQVAGTTGSVSQAISMILQERPDAVVLDMKLADGNGIDVLRAVSKEAPEVAVIVLTNHADDYYRDMCMSAGARHFFDKSCEFARIPQTLRDLRQEATARS
jgi:DNA-binding NarL/FixJ family response regulator